MYDPQLVWFTMWYLSFILILFLAAAAILCRRRRDEPQLHFSAPNPPEEPDTEEDDEPSMPEVVWEADRCEQCSQVIGASYIVGVQHWPLCYECWCEEQLY